MRRLVALSRISVIGLVLALALAACGGATTSTSSTKTSASQPAATKAAGTDGDTGNHPAAALPGLGSGCDQNTRPAIHPDDSILAAMPGGGTSMQAIEDHINQMKSQGMQPDYEFSWRPVLGPYSKIVVGVMCPDGAIYANGDPHPWVTKAHLINRDSSGRTADSRNNGMFSHVASEVLKRPCKAALQTLGPTAHSQLGTVYGVRAMCLDNGAMFDSGMFY